MLQAVQDGDEVVHFTDGALEIGPAHLRVDADLRAFHSRYHSAGHLIGLAGEKYGWLGIKGNHKPGEGRIVFEPAGALLPVTVDDLTADVAALVKRGDRRAISEAAGKRLVTWGDLKPYACGGTHVLNTAEIGTIRILKIKEKKGQLSVQYELDR
nr:alanyl-tRNA editing protein [Pantoea piersonii]